MLGMLVKRFVGYHRQSYGECTSCCANHNSLTGKYHKILITSENDFYKVVDLINNIKIENK